MKTISELRDMLREAGCTPDDTRGPVTFEWWTKGDESKPYRHMVRAVLNRCYCCGESDVGISSACGARHEKKDCNCYPCSRCGFDRSPECDKSTCKPKDLRKQLSEKGE